MISKPKSTKSSFASGASFLMIGTVLSQGIIILSSPIITRLYSPSEFGVFGMFIALFSLFFIATSLRYELAIPLPRANGLALNILILCFGLTCLIVFASLLILFFTGDYLFNLIGLSFFDPMIWLLPLSLISAGFFKPMTFWAFRNGAFRMVAIARIFQGIGLSLIQILLGLLGIGATGLIVGHMAGYFCASVVLALLLLRLNSRQWKAISLDRIRISAWRHRKFPLFSSWSDMINVFGTQFPVIFIAAAYSPIEAGFYLLANRVANAPVAVIAEAVSKSLLASAAKSRDKADIAELAVMVLKLLLRSGLGPMAILALIAYRLSGLVFGEEWVMVGTYLRYLILWTVAVYVFVPLMSLYSVLELQKQELGFQVLIFVSRILGLTIGATFGSIEYALLGFALSAAISYSACGLWILLKLDISAKKLISVFLPEITIAGASMFAVFVFGFVATKLLNLGDLTFAISESCVAILIVSGIALSVRRSLLSRS